VTTVVKATLLVVAAKVQKVIAVQVTIAIAVNLFVPLLGSLTVETVIGIALVWCT
jgi:hypothetical protein